MLFAADFDKYFVDVEGITIAYLLPFQSTGINCCEFDTPEPDCFSADSGTSLGK
jgi:hypothetical protein